MAGESSVPKTEQSTFRAADFCSEKFSDVRRRKFFRVVAKHAYPKDTVRKVQRLTGKKYADRTIYDWLAGRSEAPPSVFFQIMGEIVSD